MRKGMKTILVMHDSVFGRYLAASLYDDGKVDQVIVETRGPGLRYYWRKFRRVGPVNALFQAWLNRAFQRRGRRWLPRRTLPPHLTIDNVNEYCFDPEDFVIGFGTSLVLPHTLNSLKHGFLNLHTGWLPDFRGVKSEFWTLLQGDTERAGWTLHYMVPQLDAGDIVLRRAVPAWPDDPVALRARLLQDAVPAVGEFIEMVRHIGPERVPRMAQEGGTYYTTPTLADWRQYRRGRAGKSRSTEGNA
ncbi:MAG: formyltransferase family protein [Gemmatimonadales bacterium]